MAVAAIPDNESDRLKVLRDLEILDTPPEAEFEAIVALLHRHALHPFPCSLLSMLAVSGLNQITACPVLLKLRVTSLFVRMRF